jgi:hypothetical protein
MMKNKIYKMKTKNMLSYHTCQSEALKENVNGKKKVKKLKRPMGKW